MKHTPQKYASYLKYSIRIEGYNKIIVAERDHANYTMKLQSHRRPSRRDRQHVPALVQNLRNYGYGFDANGAPREPKTRRHRPREPETRRHRPETYAAQDKEDEGQTQKSYVSSVPFDPKRASMVTRRHRPQRNAAEAEAEAEETRRQELQELAAVEDYYRHRQQELAKSDSDSDSD